MPCVTVPTWCPSVRTVARPFKDPLTEKHDRIIAKTFHQLLRWGFSGTVIEPVIAKAAHDTLRRGNTRLGNGLYPDEDTLSTESIRALYKAWCKEKEDRKTAFTEWSEQCSLEEFVEKVFKHHSDEYEYRDNRIDDSFGVVFKRSRYTKDYLQTTGAPKQEHLGEVAAFLMDYMNQEPERCIFKSPPEWPGVGAWWRMHDGALVGDPVLSPKARAEVARGQRIKRK